MDKTWPVCIRIPKGGKWQHHPHTAYQYIWQMDHTLPEGSHELHMQEADWITETAPATARWWKDWQRQRKWGYMTEMLECTPTARPRHNNTDGNINLAQVAVSKMVSKRVGGHAGRAKAATGGEKNAGPITQVNAACAHCHDTAGQKEHATPHLITTRSPPLSPGTTVKSGESWSAKMVRKAALLLRSLLIPHDVRRRMCWCR